MISIGRIIMIKRLTLLAMLLSLFFPLQAQLANAPKREVRAV